MSISGNATHQQCINLDEAPIEDDNEVVNRVRNSNDEFESAEDEQAIDIP